MKKIGEYTTRGRVTSDVEYNRIILDDGSFQTGYRIVEFVIAPVDMDSTSIRVFTAKLTTDDSLPTTTDWNWDRNSEIGWSNFTYDGNSVSSPEYFSLVDPDNLVIQDLYITVDEGVGSSNECNYFIRMDKYDISEWQGALAMVRNKSQG